MINSNGISGILHCHTEYSYHDGCCSAAVLAGYAKKKNCPAIAITDHGNLDGIDDFSRSCRKEGIKPILGVEAYIEEQDEGRQHLVILARDRDGWESIKNAVEESRKRVFTDKSGSYPRMDKKILEANFAPGAAGHGHVFILSGCIKGPIAQMLQFNLRIKKRISRLQREQNQYVNYDSSHKLKEECEKAEQEVITLGMQCALFKDQKKEYNMYKKKLAASKRRLKNVEGRYNKAKESERKIEEIEQRIRSLRDSYNSDNYALALQEARYYQSLGGFFMELQYHGSDNERYIMPLLVKIARELGIPVVATNDIHYARMEDAKSRQFLRSVHNGSVASTFPEDKELYMKTDEELADMLLQVLPEDAVEESIRNIRHIITECSFPLYEQELEKERNYQTNTADILDLIYLCDNCLDILKNNGYNLLWDSIPFDRQALTGYLKGGRKEILELFKGKIAEVGLGKNYALAEITLYRCWYLISLDPAVFLCCVVRHDTSLLPQIQKYCFAKGIKLLRPDINRSMLYAVPDGKGILLGLGLIPGMEKAWGDICRGRAFREFADFHDLEGRTGLDKDTLHLIKNLCSCQGYSGDGQLDRQYFGVYLNLASLAGYPPCTVVTEGERDYLELYGIITGLEELYAQNGSIMCRLSLKNRSETYRITVFSGLYIRVRGRIQEGMPVKVKCEWPVREERDFRDSMNAVDLMRIHHMAYYADGSTRETDGDIPRYAQVYIQEPDGTLAPAGDGSCLTGPKKIPVL